MSVPRDIGSITRPDDWDLPLFVHIFGAMLLVGALTLSAVSLHRRMAERLGALTRLGYMTLFYGALPGYIVFRAGARMDRQQGAPSELQREPGSASATASATSASCC